MPLLYLRSVLAFAALAATSLAAQTPDAGWPTYGGDPGGQRFSAASQITKENLTRLAPAWTFHTGALTPGRPAAERASFEATPILFNGLLYLDSPYDEVFALDPATGKPVWKFDPILTRNLDAGILTSRGVASWSSPAGTGACATRIFVATFDTRLIALDAKTGARCTGFGTKGEVDLKEGVHFQADAPFYNSSPPTVVGNAVIVGSGIVDNTRVDLESGVVRAYDAVTGKPLWVWDPIPWAKSQKLRTGAANAWSVIAADPEHNLVFVPTGAASPDFFGGTRPGDDRDANSVVALEASTGRRVWGFQTVHHDLWDYDVASEPLLFTWRGKSGKENVPAIAITTKQGLVFVLNRLTGVPLVPVHEKPVPTSDIPEEKAWPTQPFSDLAPLAPITLPADAQLGHDARDNAECRELLAHFRYEGIYTPPSLRGTVAFPGNLGGVNWGSAAIDPSTGILYANTNRYAFTIQFRPRTSHLRFWLGQRSKKKLALGAIALLLFFAVPLTSMVRRRSLLPSRAAVVFSGSMIALLLIGYKIHKHRAAHGQVYHSVEHFGREEGEQFGTPYTVLRQQLIAPTSHHPCTPEPWGAVSALNLYTGQSAWQTPLGTTIPGQHTGTVNLGGDLVTASGLVFTAASEEPLLRAYDSHSGEELWQARLPVPAQATPMSYSFHGRQYIVVAAGGHGLFGTPVSDAVVAFALPQ